MEQQSTAIFDNWGRLVPRESPLLLHSGLAQLEQLEQLERPNQRIGRLEHSSTGPFETSTKKTGFTTGIERKFRSEDFERFDYVLAFDHENLSDLR